MPKLSKALKRDRKIRKRKSGMVVDNRGIFVLEEVKKKKSDKIKATRKRKWEQAREHNDAYSEIIIKEGK